MILNLEDELQSQQFTSQGLLEELKIKIDAHLDVNEHLLKKKVSILTLMRWEQKKHFHRSMKQSEIHQLYCHKRLSPDVRCQACNMFYTTLEDEVMRKCEKCDVYIHDSCIRKMKMKFNEWKKVFHSCESKYRCDLCSQGKATMKISDEKGLNIVHCHETCFYFYSIKNRYSDEKIVLPLKRLAFKGFYLKFLMINRLQAEFNVAIIGKFTPFNLIFTRTSKYLATMTLKQDGRNQIPGLNAISYDIAKISSPERSDSILNCKKIINNNMIVIDKCRGILTKWQHTGIVTITLLKLKDFYAFEESQVIPPKQANYDHLMDPKLFPCKSLIKSYNIQSYQVLSILKSLRFNVSDRVFADMMYENRESWETFRKIKRIIISGQFKFLWRFFYHKRKDFRIKLIQKMNPKVQIKESMFCICHKKEKTMVECKGGYFCKYGGKYHPGCLGLFFKSVYKSLNQIEYFAYCKSCEQERLNEAYSINAVNRVIAEFDEWLILDAVITNQIKVDSKYKQELFK
ncbi:UNKNOWN [Stylonychia lemnae]|uniref:Uncharacterized protein n=1 Tax=Stylonychia lemnae TaxID=5949 RepID=A0A078B5X3_STYLE|nr:UNKNOWN [Stylonychia lemnae]|eukprot:CDW89910.1 UNKNOWN [Stylonychia lemnae]